MNRDTWVFLGLGTLVGALVLHRSRLLGSPLEGGLAGITPHGGFGASRHGPPVHTHQGLDLVASPGTLVLAVGNGTIVDAKPGLGQLVRKLRLDGTNAWRHDARRVSTVVYADLGEALVEPGDRVRRGDAIARVGRRGFVHVAVKDEAEQFFDPHEAGFLRREVS